MTTANSLVQLTTDPGMRGRVMALYMAVFMGGTPIGAPIIGGIGDTLGPRWTILIGAFGVGVAVVIAAALEFRSGAWSGVAPWRRARPAASDLP